MLPIAVVGAGWAGLSAALTLKRSGKSVVLFEQAPLLGGRARNATWQPRNPLPLDESIAIDNGQHLLMGAYNETLALIHSMITARMFEDLFARLPVSLRDTHGFSLTAHRALLAPFHLAWALARARGLSLSERFALIRLMAWLQINQWRIKQSQMTVAQMLRATHQPPSLCTKLWHPLCISALNTPAHSASAQVFANVLKDTLGAHRAASDFLVAKVPLGNTLPALVASELNASGNCTVHTGERVLTIAKKISSSGNFWDVTSDKQTLSVQSIVLATPWAITQSLLNDAGLTIPKADPLVQLPIYTVYLYSRQPGATTREAPLMLNEDLSQQHFGHWFFDLGPTQGGGRLASVVISGPGPHQELTRQQIGEAVQQQLATQTNFTQACEHFVIGEKTATFACTAGLVRPLAKTSDDQIALCGDFYASPYPATLETAVRSGLAAARSLIN